MTSAPVSASPPDAGVLRRTVVVVTLIMIVLNVTPAREVGEIAEDERVAAKALTGEEIGD